MFDNCSSQHDNIFPTVQVGLEGEYLGLDKTNLSNSSLWTRGSVTPINQNLIWYKVCDAVNNLWFYTRNHNVTKHQIS